MCVFLVQVPGNNLHKDNKSENCIQNYELESLREKKMLSIKEYMENHDNKNEASPGWCSLVD